MTTSNEHQIVCVKTRVPGDHPSHIYELGTKTQTLTLNSVINMISSGTARFFTLVNGAKAYLVVERSSLGTLYVKTVPDYTKKDNLLSLPGCTLPASF